MCVLYTFVWTFLVLILLVGSNDVKIVTPSIIAYKPQGIKVSLPKIDGISEFFFWGNVNEKLEGTDMGTIRLSVFESTDGKWEAEDDSVSLKKGDVLNYILFVKINGFMHRSDNMSHEVTEVATLPTITTSTWSSTTFMPLVTTSITSITSLPPTTTSKLLSALVTPSKISSTQEAPSCETPNTDGDVDSEFAQIRENQNITIYDRNKLFQIHISLC